MSKFYRTFGIVFFIGILAIGFVSCDTAGGDSPSTRSDATSTTIDAYVSSSTTSVTSTSVASNQVALPTFGLEPSTYDVTIDVTLSCATSGAAIYYTTDGATTPTEGSAQYVNPIRIGYGETVKIRAIAVKSGMVGSDLLEGTFVVLEQVAAPTFNIASGTEFGTSLDIELSSATAGATIEYSTNGTDWIGGATIKIAATTTLRARAKRAGMASSEIAVAVYTKVEARCAAPVFINTTSDTSPDLASVTCEDFIKIGASGAEKISYRIQHGGVWYPGEDSWYEVIGSDATIDVSTAFSYATLNRVVAIASRSGFSDSDQTVKEFKKVEMIVAYNSSTKNIYKIVDNNLIAWGKNVTNDPFINKFGDKAFIFTTAAVQYNNKISTGFNITFGEISNVKIVKNGENFDYYVEKTSNNKIYKLNYKANEEVWRNNANGYTFINATENGDIWARDASSPVKVFKLDNEIEEFVYDKTLVNHGGLSNTLIKINLNKYYTENGSDGFRYIYKNGQSESNLINKVTSIILIDIRE